MAYRTESGNGPRAGRTTGRQRTTLVNLSSKQSAVGLPDPGFVAGYTSQMAALAQQYESRLASLRGDKASARSTYMQQLAQISGQEMSNAVAAEGSAVERGVLGGSADVKNRIAVKSEAEAMRQQAALDKQQALAAIAESGITASNSYLLQLAQLRAQRAAAEAQATVNQYDNGFDPSRKLEGEGNAQVWMNQNKEALQPYYSVASSYKTGDADAWRRLAKKMANEFYGWGAEDFAAIDSIIMRESKWNPVADNPNSTAYGIPQALMSHWGTNWQSNADAQRFMRDPVYQIAWLYKYIVDKYGTPQAALAYKDAHGNY